MFVHLIYLKIYFKALWILKFLFSLDRQLKEFQANESFFLKGQKIQETCILHPAVPSQAVSHCANHFKSLAFGFFICTTKWLDQLISFFEWWIPGGGIGFHGEFNIRAADECSCQAILKVSFGHYCRSFIKKGCKQLQVKLFKVDDLLHKRI